MLRTVRFPTTLIGNIPITMASSPTNCAVIPLGQNVTPSNTGYTAGISFPSGCTVAIGTLIGVRGILSSTTHYDSVLTAVTRAVAASQFNYGIDLPFPYKNGAWIKMKDTSYTRSNTGNFVNHLPYVIDRYLAGTSTQILVGTGESADTTSVASAIGESSAGSGGFVAADTSDLSPAGVSSPTNQWQIAGYRMNTVIAASSIEHYVRELTTTQGIESITPVSSVATVTAGRIARLTTDTSGTITVNKVAVSSTGSGVIIVQTPSGELGSIVIRQNSTPSNGFALIAKNITLDPTVGDLTGLFIATDTLNVGGGGVPLKIKGNVMAAGGMAGMRSRLDADHARPSIFIEFDMSAYQKLLPLLSLNKIRYSNRSSAE